MLEIKTLLETQKQVTYNLIYKQVIKVFKKLSHNLAVIKTNKYFLLAVCLIVAITLISK